MSKAFSAKALPNYAPFIQSKVDEVSVKLNGGTFPDLAGHWRTFNMADEVNYLMLDIMGGLCFGEPFGFIAGKGVEMMANVHARAVRIYMVRRLSQLSVRASTNECSLLDWPGASTETPVTRQAILPASVQGSTRLG